MFPGLPTLNQSLRTLLLAIAASSMQPHAKQDPAPACADLPGDGVLPPMPEQNIIAFRKGFFGGRGGARMSIRYVERDGFAIFEGDINLGAAPAVQAKFQNKHAAHPGSIVISDPSRRWTVGVIPYEIDPGLTNQQRVTDAINAWQQVTKVQFTKHNGESDYVYITSGAGCDSAVGRQGGRQLIHLADGCLTQQSIHEFGHAIGLLHEHTRSDRDNFITLDSNNIPDIWQSQFAKWAPGISQDVGPYDYCSIMHYPRIAGYGNNDLPVYEYANQCPLCIPGKGDKPSDGDVAAVTSMYPYSIRAYRRR